MVIGRKMDAASIFEWRRVCRAVASMLALAGMLAAASPEAAADEVFVREDDTPIVSKPGVGGKILIRVDTGFVLTVVGRDGDWLEVSSPFLKLPGDSLWVPADRVSDPASGSAGSPVLTVYRLEIGGTPNLRVRARCRIDEGRQDSRRAGQVRTIADNVPAVIELEGPVNCFVRMFGPPGEMIVVLRRSDGAIVASGTSFGRSEGVRVRSEGPWGGAVGVVETTGLRALAFFDPSLSGQPGVIVPPLANPVPPLLPAQ